MTLRPADGTGDILPALSSTALLKGAAAEKELVKNRLDLLAGEWWENPSLGNAVIGMLRETRFTDADLPSLSAYLSSYIRRTPGVRDVRDVSCRADGGTIFFSCTVETDSGSASIHYEF